MTSSASVAAALKEQVAAELRHRRRYLKQQEKDFHAQYGPQDAKPLAKLREFELAASDIDVAEQRLAKYAENADGSLPCPMCLALRDKNNRMSGDVRSDAMHCLTCSFVPE
jgi:hypothetical protein